MTKFFVLIVVMLLATGILGEDFHEEFCTREYRPVHVIYGNTCEEFSNPCVLGNAIRRRNLRYSDIQCRKGFCHDPWEVIPCPGLARF